MSEINYRIEEKMALEMLIDDLKFEKIHCGMTYEELKNDIKRGFRSINIHIKLHESYHLLFFKKVGFTEIYDLTILHLAMCVDDYEFVDFLLTNNVDTNITTEYVGPPIYSAIRLKKFKFVRKLVEAGASINKGFYLRGLELDEIFLRDESGTRIYCQYRYDDYNPFQYAIKVGSYNIAKFFIKRNADLNYKNSKDIPPPFNLAAQSNFIDNTIKNKLMELLIKYGADINLVNADGYCRTPLLAAACDPTNISVIKFLLNQPTIEINVVDHYKRSCLHLYLMTSEYHYDISYLDILKQILDAGVDINLFDNDQKLAIDVAVPGGRSYIKVIKKHIVILMAADMYVCPRNAEAVAGPEFEQFRTERDVEVTLLKIYREPMTGYSYYDLLHKSLHKLCLALRSGTYKENDIKNSIKDIPLEFIKIISYRMRKAIQRVELFSKCENILYSIFYNDLPTLFIHDIYFYLSNADLGKLIIYKETF